jgi:hypothetical protein
MAAADKDGDGFIEYENGEFIQVRKKTLKNNNYSKF